MSSGGNGGLVASVWDHEIGSTSKAPNKKYIQHMTLHEAQFFKIVWTEKSSLDEQLPWNTWLFHRARNS